MKVIFLKGTFFISSFFFILSLSPLIAESSTRPAIREIALVDVPYQYDPVKLSAAESPLDFSRSFVDLFYLVYSQNQSLLTGIMSLQNNWGWCVGDAHPENFGFLLQEQNQTLFTANDIDDSGPCPVALDLFRFLVTSRLAAKNLNLQKILTAYISGLNNKSILLPATLKALKTKSLDLSYLPNPKKIKANKIIRDNEMSEVPASVQLLLTQKIKEEFKSKSRSNLQILDIVSSRKIGGGSSGHLRYQILLVLDTKLLWIEFKEQTMASIYPVSPDLPNTTERIENSLALFQSPNKSKIYKPISFDGIEMLARPRFGGNIGIKLEKLSSAEIESIIVYEAFTLGKLHSESISNLPNYISQISNVPLGRWDSETRALSQYFIDKYNSILRRSNFFLSTF